MSSLARKLMRRGPNPGAMPDPAPADLAARLAQVEREVRELHARVVALERMLGAGELHPADQSTVQKKVTYDWQS
jgi:hypothetical protein